MLIIIQQENGNTIGSAPEPGGASTLESGTEESHYSERDTGQTGDPTRGF